MNSKKEIFKNQVKASLVKVKKIPVWVAFFLTTVGLVGGVFLINKSQSFFSKASSENLPSQIKITNIDSNSFVVSWITETQTPGKILYGETNATGETKKDVRDENKSVLGSYKTHFVLIDNLKPKTKYYFKIASGDKTYLQANKPYEVTTALEKAFPNSDISQGRVLNTNGSPAFGAIVYLSLPNAITQAALVEENGYWMILLSRTRSGDLQNYLNYDQTAQIAEISVQAGGQTASATLTTGNDNPTPDITLGQTYDFIKSPNIPTPTITVNSNPFPTDNPQKLSFDSLGQNQDVVIVYPSEEETINSQTPEFFGTGPKEKILEILIESAEKISDETTITNQGQWQWTPDQPLTPGEHQITVTYTDQDGFVQKVSRSFTVLAAGTSDLPSFTATSSANTTSPTPLPTSKLLSPTPSPTAAVLISPTEKPIRTTVPSGEVPRSGNSLPTWVFLGGGFLLVIVGAAFLLL